jgi:myo-inositol-1(or 4)-monophosphatase
VENLNVIKPQAEDVIRNAGAFILREFRQVKREDIDYKGVHDLVSYVDKAAEEILVEGLKDLWPGAAILAEEGTVTNEKKDWEWIIDPLDGTTNYLHHLPIFAVSVALAHHSVPKIGWVYELNRDELFFAAEGKGAFCNGNPIEVTKTPQLDQGLIATGFPYYDFDKMPQYLAILHDLMKNSHGLRRMGSAAVDLAYVACGRVDAFFEYNLNAWDVAAGALLVQEAGGKLSTFNGGDDYIFGREILATNTRIHPELLEVVMKHW